MEKNSKNSTLGPGGKKIYNQALPKIDPSKSLIRFIHLHTSAPPLEIAIDGQKINLVYNYQTINPHYLTVSAGPHNVKLYNYSNKQLISDLETDSLKPNAHYTFVIFGSEDQIKFRLFFDNNNCSDSRYATLRILNFSPYLPNPVVKIEKTKKDVPYTQYTNFSNTLSTGYNLRVVWYIDDEVVWDFTMEENLMPGGVFTLFVSGQPGSPHRPLSNFLSEDSECSR